MAVALFDLDDTLTDRRAIFREWATGFARRHTLDVEAVEWIVALDSDGNRPRPEFFEMVIEKYSLPYSPDDHDEIYYAEYTALYRLSHDTIQALKQLRTSGWKIGIVTNGGPTQQAKIDYAGLSDLVDSCSISGVVGAWKPDGAIFRHALQQCGSPPDGGWMVGDNSVADIGGGQAAGLRTIWLHHGRRWPEELAYRPDYQTASVAEATRIILSGPNPVGTDTLL